MTTMVRDGVHASAWVSDTIFLHYTHYALTCRGTITITTFVKAHTQEKQSHVNLVYSPGPSHRVIKLLVNLAALRTASSPSPP